MSNQTIKQILSIIESISAEAQNGRNYCKNPFDIHHYETILELLQKLLQMLLSDSTVNRDLADSFIKARFVLSEEDYITPKVSVATVAMNNNYVLLVKRANDLWSLPGGYSDVGR